MSSGYLLSSPDAVQFDYSTDDVNEVSCCGSCSAWEGCVAWSLRIVAHGFFKCTLHADLGPPNTLEIVHDQEAIHGVRKCAHRFLLTSILP